MGMETRFHRLFVCFQVVLAYESIVLCMCSGNVLIGYHNPSDILCTFTKNVGFTHYLKTCHVYYMWF